MSVETATSKLLILASWLLLWPVMAMGQVADPDQLDGAGSARSRPRVAEAYGKLPMSFEANQGQADSRVKFLSRGSGYGLFLTPNEIVLSLSTPGQEPGRKSVSKRERKSRDKAGPAVLRMKLKAANPSPQVVGLEELPGKSNYFIGNDPKKWRTNVPNYRKVKYQDVYPGVDLVFYGREHQLEYDLIVAPGADPSAIRLGFEGAERLRIDSQGDLVFKTKDGEAYQRKPVIYQEITGVRQSISGRYVLRGKQEVSFEVAAYDASSPLVIDPVLSYSTLLGGDPGDWGYSIAVDDDHNAYVTGVTRSARFPTANPFQANKASTWDAFITKLNPEGSVLVYSTYLGGDGGVTSGDDIAVDSQNNVYVTGVTVSPNFPRVGAVQNTFGGLYDAFVAKLNPSGSALVYATYLGGTGGDRGFGVALDAQGNTYVVGDTGSSSFAASPPPIDVFRANQGLGLGLYSDVFVTKLNPAGSVLIYLTYLNGDSYEQEPRIAVDRGGSVYVTGHTASSPQTDRVGNPFPASLDAFQTSHGGATWDAFVTKLNPAGSAVVYSTYLGGESLDYGYGIAVDPDCVSDCNAYLTGSTSSANFPTTPSALWPTFGGGIEDAFVTRLNASGSELVYSTFLGREWQDRAHGIAVDGRGDAYVTGSSVPASFPDDKCPVRIVVGPGGRVFIVKLNAEGTALNYCAFLGGSGGDWGSGIAVDVSGDAYVTGQAGSVDFPTTPSAFQRTGGNVAFIAKIADPDGGGARLQFSSPTYSVIEDRGTAVIIVTRRGNLDGTVTVDYSTSDGTATAPADYVATSGTLSFADRETAKAFTVPIVDDVLVEGDETVNLTLSNPIGGATLGFPNTAVLTILDDDGLSRTFVVRDRVLPTGPNWTASEDIPWLSLDAYSGTGPSTVTATADPTGLPVGTYTGTITVTGDTGDSPQVVQVTLRVVS